MPRSIARARIALPISSGCDGKLLMEERYFRYYHRSRCHLSLVGDALEPRPVLGLQLGGVVELPEVGEGRWPSSSIHRASGLIPVEDVFFGKDSAESLLSARH